MLDAMVYAEIMLYMILQDKFAQRSYLGSDGACEELSAWKTRWNYLFGKSRTQLVPTTRRRTLKDEAPTMTYPSIIMPVGIMENSDVLNEQIFPPRQH